MDEKNKNIGLQFFAREPKPEPGGIVAFSNNFFVDDELMNIVTSASVDLNFPQDVVTSLWIVYKNKSIYGLVEYSQPTVDDILSDGSVIVSNVRPEYTGSFYENPHGSGTQSDPYYLVEDEVVRAGYWLDFVTYHTSLPDGYTITYESNGGTPIPESVSAQSQLPDTLPAVEKNNSTFAGWFYDSDFQTQANGGDVLNGDVTLYAKFVLVNITLDLSAIGLPTGTHEIQIRLSDDGLTKPDSELSNKVIYNAIEWDDPELVDGVLKIKQVYSAEQVGDTLYIDHVAPT